MSNYAEVKSNLVTFFTTKNYIGIVLRITERMDDLRGDQIGKPFLTHTWVQDDVPPFTPENIAELLSDQEILKRSFEGNKAILSATEGEAIGKAIDNANTIMKERHKS